MALERLLRGWTVSPEVELIVALPLGDRDGFRDLEHEIGSARWVEAPRGRASQMNAGAAEARGKWLVFLHADSQLPPSWLDVIRAVEEQEHIAGGSFRFALDSHDWRARVIERAVALRVRLLRLPYGDQAIFVRRTVFERLGGYADLPLMEDVDLIWRLRAAGHLHFSAAVVTTSARRWTEEGWLRRSVSNMGLAVRFGLGAAPARLAQRYFGRGPTALVMMGRVPWNGGKTRLHAADESAHRSLREALFFDTLDALRSVPGADAVVACEPPNDVPAIRQAVGAAVDVCAQRGASLGERMLHAFDDTFRLGYESVIIVGSDLPDLPRDVLLDAVAALADRHDRVVLGPARDGGYYLMGLNRRHPCLFEGIDWGTERVLAQTKAAAASARLPVHCVAEWGDIDNQDDLARLAAVPRGERARRTREWLRRHQLLLLLVALCTACSRDPGLDVKPMPDPLRGAAVAPSSEIIPLEQVRKSQAAAVSQRIANTEITITYSRPVARGRDLFGALIPYDAVWNPGADRATAIALTRNVTFDGQALAAGRYSLWVIPRRDLWTVIFNNAADVYHTPYPGADRDVLRLDVSPRRGPHTEALAFTFPAVEGKDAVLQLEWGEVRIPLSIHVP